MDSHVYPAEPIYDAQVAELESHFDAPPIMADLKAEARSRGLWNLFLPDDEWGVGLRNIDYAPLMGRSAWIAPEATNCSAPDTGNMEVLADFGTAEQQQHWLVPLLDGEIRSCFSMTERDVASSDPRNLETRIERDGAEYLVNGTKWWSTGVSGSTARIAIVMGVTNADADPKGRYSMLLVPLDAPGVKHQTVYHCLRLSRQRGSR